MKKLILIAGVALFSHNASAQLSVGPEAGFLVTGVNIRTGGDKFDTELKTGFRAGANLDIGIAKHFHLQAGVFYTVKGYQLKFDESFEPSPIKNLKVSINYLEIPVYINYMSGKPGGNRFFAGAGPYLGYAINGTSKADGGERQDLSIGTEKGKDNFKPMDFGMNLNAGFMLSIGVYVRAHYSFGLSNIAPSGNDDNTFKNKGFGISAGYAFKL